MRARGRITAVAARAIAVAIAGTLLAPLGASSAPGAASAFVRVNQVGYPATATKRAYLLASGTETGATFVVRNTAGAAVGGGTVGADLGSWSNAFPHVYAIDFDALATAGTYRITVDGPIPASSPSFASRPARRSTARRCATRGRSIGTSATAPGTSRRRSEPRLRT
jgi:endoglucanase